jgi:hypothetical protein
VTSLSKGQQLARVSRKLAWHWAGIGATLTSEVQKERVIRKGLRFNKLFELFCKRSGFPTQRHVSLVTVLSKSLFQRQRKPAPF